MNRPTGCLYVTPLGSVSSTSSMSAMFDLKLFVRRRWTLDRVFLEIELRLLSRSQWFDMHIPGCTGLGRYLSPQ